MKSKSFTSAVADYFKAHQGEWIDGMVLATIAGSYAWRSRVSEARRRGLQIENRQRRIGKRVISEYRFTLKEQSRRQADLFAEAR